MFIIFLCKWGTLSMKNNNNKSYRYRHYCQYSIQKYYLLATGGLFAYFPFTILNLNYFSKQKILIF